jgi:hypothetical protein
LLRMDDRKLYACVATCVLAYLTTVLGITAVSTTYWATFYGRDLSRPSSSGASVRSVRPHVRLSLRVFSITTTLPLYCTVRGQPRDSV